MKYQAVNQLQLFEYHDAELTDVCVDDTVLRCKASGINIHADAPQNPYDTDMCIDDARVTLYGFCLHELSYPEIHVTDQHGQKSIVKGYSLTGEAMQERFNQRKDQCIWVYGLEEGRQGNRICCEIETSTDDFAVAQISFDKVLIEWDAYAGKAWYEKNK